MIWMVSAYERRIGGRVDMAAIPVQWRVPREGQKRRSGWRRSPKPGSGLLLDMSVSGLQVRAPAAPDLHRGSEVGLALDGVVGWGTIRRINPVPRTKMCDYGLELARESEELVQWVHDRVAAASSRLAAEDWRSDRT